MSLDMLAAAVCLGGGGFGGPGTGTYQCSKLGSVVTRESTLTMRSFSDLPSAFAIPGRAATASGVGR
eukprot:4251318-Amphidinium_carterae.1